MKKTLLAGIVAASSVLFANMAFAGGTDARALTTLENTTKHEVLAEVKRFKGYDAVNIRVSPDHKSIEQGGCDNCTFLKIDDIDFKDGAIDIDVASQILPNSPAWARGFIGVVFRVNDDASKYEGIYLRPVNATEKKQIQRNHSVQYFSYPDHPWKTLRESQPGHYESWADIRLGEWTHMRIEVKGETAKLYLNHQENPVLVVNDMKHGADLSGKIGLFTEPTTDAFYRNLVVTHAE